MRIRLLGPVDVVSGALAVPLGGAKERVLLTALALNPGEVVPASRLADTLWGDEPPRTATATLRSHVSRLRRALHPGGFELTTTAGGLCLRTPDDGVDLAVVEALVQRARSGGPREAAAALAEALAQWRGPSLGDLAELPFAQADAARLDEFRAALLEQRVEADLACGRHGELAAELELLCGQHPYREGLWASRILALYRCGRQADALRVYGELRRRLAEDLGIDPSPQLRGLEQAVLTQSPALDWRDEQGPRIAPAHERRVPVRADRPLAGRRQELDQLRGAWSRAAAGQAAAVLLAGEPGIGKTRLALAAVELAEAADGVAVYGRCDDQVPRPFGPVAEAAERLLAVLPPEERDAMVRPWASELSALLPGLDTTGRAPELGERSAVFEAVVGVLAAASARSPLLIVLDDLQWAGPETILLISHVLRARVPLRVLLVATYRDTEVGPDHPVTNLLGEAGAVRLELRGLAGAELAELLGRDDVEHVERHSGGNPFIALELDRDPSGGGEVRDVLRRRFWQLGPAAYEVLRVAAVLGEEFSCRLLEEVVADADVLDALDAGVQARLLEDRGAGRFAFVHALVRATLLAELNSARRARLHRRVVETLWESPDDEQHLDELAHHSAEAVADGSPLELAVDSAIRCARQAVRQLAPERALAVLDRAEHLVDGRVRVDRALRCDLRLARAEVLGFIGERAGLRQLALAAADDARAARCGVRVARCARQHFGWGEIGQHDPDTIALCVEALELLGEEEPRWRAEVLAVQSQVLGNNLGEGREAALLAEEAVEVARRSGDPDALVFSLVALDRAWQGQPDGCARRLEVNDELVRVASVAADEAMRFAGIRQQAATRLTLGDVSGFEAERRAMERLHGEVGSWFSTFWVRCYAVTAAILAGRFEQAATELDELTDHLAGETNAVTMWAGMHALLARERGEPGALVAAMDDAIERFDGLTIFRVGAASFLAEAGDLAGASSRYEELVADDLALLPRDSTFPACLGGLVETAVRLRDTERAPMLRSHLEPYAGQFVVTGAGSFCYASVDRLLGMLAALEGRVDEAVEAYGRALRLEVATGAEPFQVRTRRWMGECLLARGGAGDAALAAELLTAAAADAQRLGMPLVLAEIEPLLAWATTTLQPSDHEAATSIAQIDRYAPPC